MELVDDLMRQRGGGRLFDIVMLDADEDGVAQIDRVLAGEHDLAAIHILSHGASGSIGLGSSRVDAGFLADHEAAVAGWGRALQADGDLLLYGCDVAAGEQGRAFLQQLARLTGADVAASDDATGDTALGGNWRLEARVGLVEAAVAIDADGQARWHGLLANSAPVLSGANNLDPVAEDATGNAGTLVSALIAGRVTDADAGALQGIAVTAVNNANGAWQYTTDGGTTWTSFGTPSTTAARLLSADASTAVRFVPNANWNGTVGNGLTFYAWDQSTGSAGATADLTSTRTVLDSFTTASYANNNGTASWTAGWVESDNNGGGATGGNILITGGQLRVQARSTSDSIYREANLSGATTATVSFGYTNSLSGSDSVSFQVSGNGGASYTTLVTFSGSSSTGSGTRSFDIGAFVAGNTRIRFDVGNAPNSSYLYIDNLQIAYNGGAPATGGATAFSSASAASSVTVTPVNDAPTATITRASYAATEQATLALQGTGLSIADTDAGGAPVTATVSVTEGVLTAAAGTTGATVAGSGTSAVTLTGTVAQINSLLAGSAGATLSYLNPSDNPPPSVTLTLAVDDGGNSGAGGAKTGADSATIAIAPVNDAPVLSGANNLAPIAEDAAGNAGTLVSALIAGRATDVDSSPLGIAVTAVNNANGAWQYTTDGGLTWLAFGTPSTTAARLLAADANTAVRFVPNANWNGTVTNGLTFYAWDQSTGSAGGTADLTSTRTVLDSFTTASYANNDGTASWSAGWVESDNNGGGATGGNIHVTGGRLRVQAKEQRTRSTARPTSAARASATLSFGYTNRSATRSAVDFQVSSNGGASYTTLTTFNKNSSTGSGTKQLRHQRLHRRQHAHPLRRQLGTKDSDYLYVDNLQITYNLSTPATGGATAFSSASAASSVTVTPVNDAPTATIGPASYAAFEQATLTLHGTGLSIADVDAGGAAVTATVSVTEGVLTAAAGTTGATVAGSGTSAVTLTGTVAQINSLLAGSAGATLSYLNPSDNPPPSVTLTLAVDDGGNSGAGGAKTGADSATIAIAPVNDAPVLSGANNLAAIAEDPASNAGTLVSALIAGRATDVDSSPLGIAVTAVNNANGAWQYTTDGGLTWLAFGTPSTTAARLLAADANTAVRFIPNANWNGTVTNGLTFYAWDRSSGSAGATADLTSTRTVLDSFTTASYANNNGTTSWTAGWVESDSNGGGATGGNILVTGGRLRVQARSTSDSIYREANLSGAKTATLSFDYTNSLGSSDTVLIQVSANGGASYTTLGTFNNSTSTGSGTKSYDIAGYIAANTRIRFNVTSTGSNNYFYVDNVKLAYNGGAPATGGSTAFSSASAASSVTVTPVNDAPVLAAASPTLAALTEDQTANTGSQVSALLGTTVTDVDSGAVQGIAITSVSSGNGSWQYSTNAGANWNPVGTVGAGSALLLRASDYVRFVPDAMNGTTASFTYRAWDQTAGTVGSKANAGTTGGSTPFSTGSNTASITVSSLNDAPVLGNGTLAAVLEDTAAPAGQSVATVFAGQFSDVDAGSSFRGVAVVGNSAVAGTQGSWQYSSNNGANWFAIGSVTDGTTALALNTTTLLRFVPAANFNGPAPDLVVRALDNTYAGSFSATSTSETRVVVNTTTNGGTSAVAGATSRLATTVTAVNDAPVGTSRTVTTNEDTAYVFTIADFGLTDPADSAGAAGANALNAVRISTLPAAGSLTYNGVAVTAGQFVSAADIAAGLLVLTPAANASGTPYASFTFQVQDDGGTANGGTNLDATARTMTVNVAAVNDAPSLGLPVAQNTTSNVDVVFSSANGNAITIADVDAGAGAVKLTLNIANGTLTLAGTTGLTFVTGANGTGAMSFTGTLANINTALNGLRYRPTTGYAGSTPLALTVDDQGNAGSGGALAASGSAVINVAYANMAPVLSGANALNAINEDDRNSAGTSVSALVAGKVSDGNADALSGIAVTAVDNGNGAWQYTTNGGTTWSAFGTPSATTARLLAADASTFVRFVPNANWNGTVAGGLTFQAWDRTSGAAGGTGNATVKGGATAFSSASASAGITVNPVNDAPVLDASRSPVLANAREDAGAPSGAVGSLVSSLVDFAVPAGQLDNVTDIDAAASTGIAVVGADTSHGSWYYSTDNGTSWAALGAVSNGSARLLAADGATRLYFQAAANFNGTLAAAITFRAWDQSTGSNGAAAVDTGANGGTTAFSSATDTAALTVDAVNDAPVGAGRSVVIEEDDPYVFSLSDFAFGDPNDTPANAFVAVKVTGLPVGGLLLLNGTAVGLNQFVSVADIAAGAFSFAPAADLNGTAAASFTFRVQDSGGTANGGSDLDAVARTFAFDITPVNDAPVGNDRAVDAVEDAAYVFKATDFGFTDPKDAAGASGANALLAVRIVVLPDGGSLTLSGIAVNAGDVVGVARINAGDLRYLPVADVNGPGVASFTFRVQDNGGTANGGTDLDEAERTLTVNVLPVNDAPAGTDGSVSAVEDTPYVFVRGDFGFTDPADAGEWSGANSLSAVRISSLPTAGSLTLGGAAVAVDQLVSVADIDAGRLRFTAAPDASGDGYASFSFRVQDDGGTGSGGVNLDPVARLLTVDVAAANDPPARTAGTVGNLVVREDAAATSLGLGLLAYGPGGGSDEAAQLLTYAVTLVPDAALGWVLLADGVTVVAPGAYTLADLRGMTFRAAADASGGPAVFAWTVTDDGGGSDTLAESLTITVTPVNDAPAGTSRTVVTNEDTAYVFTAGSFGFSDASDTPANSLRAVRIATLPTAGALTLSGTAVTAGQFVLATDIDAGKLRYTPAADANGAGYASFTFQVQDDGGTASGGADLDPTPDTITIDVTAVNDAPTLASGTVATLAGTDENTASGGTTVASLLAQAGWSDVDAGAAKGIAVTSAAGNGGWQYSTDGTSWTAFGAVSAGNALLLGSTAQVRYLPDGLNGETAGFGFRAWDQTAGTASTNAAPAYANTTASGGTTAYSSQSATASMTVSSVNDAPTLASGAVATLAGTDENTASGGTTVASLLAQAGWSDVDAGAAKGIAVTSAAGNGGWQYSTDGTSWTAFGAVSAGNALLLGSTAQVRYLPDGLNGETSGFGFRAWDQTAGTASTNAAPAYANTTASGGTTAYSSQSATASMTVSSVNDAPTLASGAVATLAGTDENTASGGTTVANLLAATGGADVDAGAARGIAVTSAAGNGGWQYSTDGASWTAFGAVSAGNALLLGSTAQVRYLPDGLNGETSGFGFRAWDQTAGTASTNAVRSYANPGSGGGATAYSSQSASASLAVAAVNDAPAGANKTVTTREDTAYVFTIADFGFTDPVDRPMNALAGVRIATLPGAGSLTLAGVAVGAGQTVSAAAIAGGDLAFTPAANANGTGYAGFTFQVQDDGGTANGGIDLDPTPRSMTVNVTAVNDAPRGTSRTVTTPEDTAYVFSAADFGFGDPDDTPANAFSSVMIASLPGAGSLTLAGTAVTAGQFVSVTSLNAGSLKFSPAADANGTGYASFTFRVQDNGGTANGGTALDPVARTMTLDVTPVNDAPTHALPGAQATARNTPLVFSPATGNALSVSDIDAGATAIQVTLSTDHGTLGLSGTGGLSFSPGSSAVGASMTFSGSIADINRALDGLTFDPSTDYAGAAMLTMSSDDLGNSGGGGRRTATGTVSINVDFTNQAPVLRGANDLAAIAEDSTTGDGTLVSALIAGQVDDGDADALAGIAVIAVDDSHGRWQYSTDAGARWNDFGTPAGTTARLLAADADSRVRFVPDADWNGRVGQGLTFRAWDRTSGTAGGTADASVNGGATAFSAETASSGLTVDSVNDAPSGADRTVSLLEDGVHVFTAADFGFSDQADQPAADAFAGIRVTALPGAGTLTRNGVAVAAGDLVSADDIAAGRLVFAPAPNAAGAGYAAFSFQVKDDGGTAGGGADCDPVARTLTLDVTPVNDAPSGADRTVTTREDHAYVFTTADFGFADAADGNALAQVRISMPASGAGVLSAGGIAVTGTAVVSAADIAAGRLVYTPAADVNGSSIAFGFQVQDDGGTADGGADTDPVVRTMTVAVTPVNDAPTGADSTVALLEDASYTFTLADFGFADGSDSPADALKAVGIVTLPAAGRLTNDGVAVTAGQFIDAADIAAGRLVYRPAADASGTGYASFTFQLQDDGGTAGGGVDESVIANRITFDVTPVDDAPVVVMGAASPLSYTENAPATTIDAGISVDDIDSPMLTGATVSISGNYAVGEDVLSFAGQPGIVGSWDAASGVLTLSGSATTGAYTAALRSVAYADLGDNPSTAPRTVSFVVSDGSTDSAAATRRIDVVAINDAPVLVASAGLTVPENRFGSVIDGSRLSTTDADDGAAQLVYTLTAAPVHGTLRLGSAALGAGDSFTQADIDGGSLAYDHDGSETDRDGFDFTVADAAGSSKSGSFQITVTPANDNAPVITSNGGGAGATVGVAENTTAVTTVTATDADLPAQALGFGIVGGADAAKFAIDAATGALRFITAPDHEQPTDADGDNVYDVVVRVSDGALHDDQAIAVMVTPVNDNAPVIASNGGGASASVSVAENTTAVTTVTATDADLPAQALGFSIVGGADAARFAIDATTGALSFKAAPDHEQPTDADGDNVYDVVVRVSDGALHDDQAIAVTVTPANDNVPVITSNGGGASASVSVAENTTAVTVMTATDADLPAQTLSYSIVGGADAARFSIDATTGALSFKAAPDYEAPTDANGDNIYDVVVRVSDGMLDDDQAIAVTVTPANDNAPVITSNGGGAGASIGMAENTTAVTTVTATDADLPAQTLSYSIVGGADATKFAIDATTGALRFVVAPDHELPSDADGDNVYDVVVRVSDGPLHDDQAIAVTVTPANDNAPVITSNGGGASASIGVAENTTAVTVVAATDADLPAQALGFSIVGGADAAKFSIDATTGALRFITAPDHEQPADADGDNVYDVVVRVSDGTLDDDQAIAITVTPVNDNAPVITSNGGGASASVSMAENTTVVTTVTATDADLPMQTLSFSIVGGADAARFAIDATTGALRLVAAPDHELPSDADGDNVYDVVVRVSDGMLDDDQAIAVTVTPANDNAPVVTSNGGGASASIGVAENTTAVTVVAATDADLPAQALSFSIVGGADAAKFAIDATTGALHFITAPDHEQPTDADGDNVYDIVVRVSDGTLDDDQAIAVTVTPTNDNAPMITSNGGGASASVSVAENMTAVTTVTATDADLPAQTLSYSIVGGADATKFAIDATTGALRFVAAPDHELPSDADGDNVYDVVVRVSDGVLDDDQAIAVTVTPANDNAPVITSNGGGASASVSMAENTTVVTTVTATDADLPMQTLSFSIVGGTDAARFAIDATTGALSFKAAPDYEAPTDADGDNVYNVIVRVSDGTLDDDQAIAVTVTPVNDNAPVIASNGGGAGASIGVAENTTAVTVMTATDADMPAQTLSYSIVGGADAARFAIDATTGALSFKAAPDHEQPTDADGDNVYDVVVRVSDGALHDDQAIAVTVLDVVERPVAREQSASVAEGASVSLNLAAGSVPAGPDAGSAVDAAHPVIVAGPRHGLIVLLDDGTQVYLHDGSETTGDSLTFRLRDARSLLSDTVTLQLRVTPVNDAPTLATGPLAVRALDGVLLEPRHLAARDADDEAAALVFVVTDVRHGRFESTGRPGSAIVSFTQAELVAGRVRLVSTSATDAPFFRVAAFDGKDRSETVDATVSFGRDALIALAATGPAAAAAGAAPLAGGADGQAGPARTTVSSAGAERPSPVREVAVVAERGEPALGLLAPRASLDIAPPPRQAQDSSTASPAARPRAAAEHAEPGIGADIEAYLLGPLQAQPLNDYQLAGHVLRGGSPGTASVDDRAVVEEPASLGLTLAETVQVAGLSLTAGTVWWALRGGGLLSSLLVSLPAWRHADLLAVLPDDDGAGAWDEAEDDEAARDELAVAQVLGGSQGERE